MTSYDRVRPVARQQDQRGLQSEAAWVYYKMGNALADGSRNGQEAEQAFDRRSANLRRPLDNRVANPGLLAQIHPGLRGNQPLASRLPLDACERLVQLKRMDRPAGRSSSFAERFEYLRARLQLLAKLGLVRYQLLQPDARSHIPAGDRPGRLS